MSITMTYDRPKTRGELARLLKSGVPCEVVTSNANITYSMLIGWLGFGDELSVRPSENEGWSIFEA